MKVSVKVWPCASAVETGKSEMEATDEKLCLKEKHKYESNECVREKVRRMYHNAEEWSKK